MTKNVRKVAHRDKPTEPNSAVPQSSMRQFSIFQLVVLVLPATALHFALTALINYFRSSNKMGFFLAKYITIHWSSLFWLNNKQIYYMGESETLLSAFFFQQHTSRFQKTSSDKSTVSSFPRIKWLAKLAAKLKKKEGWESEYNINVLLLVDMANMSVNSSVFASAKF